jgi:hypothetical protein
MRAERMSTEEQKGSTVGDEASRRKVADLRTVDQGLGGEVEAGEIPHERELRQRCPTRFVQSHADRGTRCRSSGDGKFW